MPTISTVNVDINAQTVVATLSDGSTVQLFPVTVGANPQNVTLTSGETVTVHAQ